MSRRFVVEGKWNMPTCFYKIKWGENWQKHPINQLPINLNFKLYANVNLFSSAAKLH